MLESHAIADLSHFDLHRILDFVKANCDPRDKDAPFNAKQYADLSNFAATNRRHRRALMEWSRDMYDRLEIELMQVREFKKLTFKFNEIPRTHEGVPKAKMDWYIDVYIKAMLRNQSLECIELRYAPNEYFTDHKEDFQRIVSAIQAASHNRTKLKEIIVNTGEFEFSGLGLFRNITRLRVISPARFPMSDLVEFCKQNPSLSTLEMNTYVFSDHGKLTSIVEHCRSLKELKFVMSDNKWIRDEEYVKLANLKWLQRLEVRKPDKIEYKMEMEEEYESSTKRRRMEAGCEALIEPEEMEEEQEEEYESSTKRRRMEAGYEALIEPEEPKEPNVPLRSLLAAISARERQTLSQLILKFEIDKDLAETIGNIKSLRRLECGLYDPRSFKHFAKLDKLAQLNLLNKGHLISPDVLLFLSRYITVSSFDTKMSFDPRGTLYITSSDPNRFRNADFALLLNLENFKCLCLSSTKMLTTFNYSSLLEKGIEIICGNVSVTFNTESRELSIYLEFDTTLTLPLPIIENLQSFTLLSRAEPRLRLLNSVAVHYSKTLQEVCIRASDFDRLDYLREEDVAAVAQITSLRRVSCELQKLKYIQPLAQLMELEKLVVLSEHNPRQVEFARCMLPILERCPKLCFFEISVAPRRLPKQFFMHLEDKLILSGRPILPKLHICLCLSVSPYSFTERELKQIQKMERASMHSKFEEQQSNFLDF